MKSAVCLLTPHLCGNVLQVASRTLYLMTWCRFYSSMLPQNRMASVLPCLWSAAFINFSTADHVFQYYLDVVSTKVKSRRVNTQTYQFSVSDQSRAVDHSTGSHGMPGVYFKYDFSPVSVAITEKKLAPGHFFTRICGIVGGVFATSCIVNGLIGFAHRTFFAKRTDSSARATRSTSQTVAVPGGVGLDDTQPLYNVQLVSNWRGGGYLLFYCRS